MTKNPEETEPLKSDTDKQQSDIFFETGNDDLDESNRFFSAFRSARRHFGYYCGEWTNYILGMVAMIISVILLIFIFSKLGFVFQVLLFCGLLVLSMYCFCT